MASAFEDSSLVLQHDRPKSFRCSLRTLMNLPKRIFFPPAIPSAPKFKVRSCTSTPLEQVTLEKILNDEFLPPLTLVDFQDYLVFIEKASENLFYLRWLTHYAALHDELTSCSNDDKEKQSNLIDEMSQQFQRSLSTFILPGSPYQLNLPASTINNLLAIAPQQYVTADSIRNNGVHNGVHHAVLPPPPNAPAIIVSKNQVTDMLRESASRFAKKSPANGGRKRGWFALFVGVVSCLFGLLIALVARLYQKGDGGKRTAGAAIPFWFLGVATFVCGLHGICIVVFMFGDARQLHPFELEMPVENTNTNSYTNSQTDTSQSATLGVGADLYGIKQSSSSSLNSDKSTSGNTDSERTKYHPNRVSVIERGELYAYNDDNLKVKNDEMVDIKSSRMFKKFNQVPPMKSQIRYRKGPYINTPFHNNDPGNLKEFGTISPQSIPKSASNRNVFEPLTSVDEPLVSRVQAQVFILSLFWGLIIAVVAGTLAIVL